MSDEILKAILELKEDFGGMKADVATIKDAVQPIEARVRGLEKSHSRLKGYGAGVVAAASAVGAYLKLHS